MRLSAMMNLVLKKVHEQAIAAFDLDVLASIDPHLAVQRGWRERVAGTHQTLVHRRLSWRKLGKSRKRNRIFPGLRPEPSALQRIDVKKIDDIDVVQRCLQAREEARSLSGKFGRGQFGAGDEQAMVRPGIVAGKGAVGLNEPGRHYDFLIRGEFCRNRLVTCPDQAPRDVASRMTSR